MLPENIASAVGKKQRREDFETTELIIRGFRPCRLQPARRRYESDFLALKSQDGPGPGIQTASGTISADINPPNGNDED
jgi:hypothetical protein